MNALTKIETHQRIGLTATDFLTLADAGAFADYARTELIEGEIWVVNAVHSWHARSMSEITVELANALRRSNSALRVFSAGSILMSDDSVPEPDISIAEDNIEGVLPLAKVRLAVEISDSTAAFDLGRKRRLYARAGVPEYWVVERNTSTIHQFWAPVDETFGSSRTAAFGTIVSAVTLPDVTVDSSRIL